MITVQRPSRAIPSCLLLVVGLCLAPAARVSAAIPQTMSYQGLLLNPGGSAVADGAYDLTFKIYNVAVPSDPPEPPLWSETHEDVVVTRGVFNVVLGMPVIGTAVPVNLSFNEQYWLGVAVGAGAELTPRVKLAASPYSLNARAVEDNAITSPKIADASIAAADVGAAQLVKSLSGLKDDVALAAGSNISITPAGQTLTIAATGVGLILPYRNQVADAGALFDVSNSGTGGGGIFENNDATSAALFADNRGGGPVFHAEGIVDLGSPGEDGHVRLFQNGNFTPILEIRDDGNDGAGIFGQDGVNLIYTLQPDASGPGAFFSINRNSPSTGFQVDGNFAGTENTRVTISGAAHTIDLNTGGSGNATVALPGDAISALEMFDEPGVASQIDAIQASLTGPLETLTSRTITVPQAGWVLVIASMQVNLTHVSGTATSANLGVSASSASLPSNQDITVEIPSGAVSGTFRQAVTVHGLFSVSAGANTLYLLGDEGALVAGADVSVADIQLTLAYFPTAYGTVTPTIVAGPGGGAETESSMGARTAWSEAGIAAEQSEARSFHIDRLQKEMAAIRAQFEQLQREMITAAAAQKERR